MLIDIQVHLHYTFAQRTDLLMQIEAAATPSQTIVNASIGLSHTHAFSRVGAEEEVGERIWLQMDDALICDYTATIEIDRPPVDLVQLKAQPLHLLSADTVKYLLPSRYCHADDFLNFVHFEFADLSGGARVAAMAQWINERFVYAPGTTNAMTTDLDTFAQRQGVCRDFAHMLVSLCRASAIPARFVSCFAPDVNPPDFHAVAEVYLEGGWHLVDPSGMAAPETIACIGVGRDAADVAFLTSFDAIALQAQWVRVSRR
ncbi:MAG: transglutaminase family protein [Ahrensia sp.]